MGWETFCDGLKIYFKKFSWGNTCLEDFIGCLQQGFDQSTHANKFSLTEWGQQWLKTKGPNKVTYEYE
jgi:aminopeptidase N